jgi:hypothetical protein
MIGVDAQPKRLNGKDSCFIGQAVKLARGKKACLSAALARHAASV